ncbi:hypothetical protein C7E23_06885 [Elizabethkingia anophelis]|nr:hypothetical protein C7E23_06885 [Elizabethkingia anophelis]
MVWNPQLKYMKNNLVIMIQVEILSKKLNVLNDYLERSLSRNNFRYMAVIYYTSNSKQLISETEWNFNYDSNGNIISSNSITLE